VAAWQVTQPDFIPLQKLLAVRAFQHALSQQVQGAHILDPRPLQHVRISEQAVGDADTASGVRRE
jgi:hypothetical protein